MDRQTILNMTVDALKQELAELNLQVSGKKVELQNRLLTHYELEEEEVSVQAQEQTVVSHFTLKDVQESLSCFDGTRPSVSQWLAQFEDSAAAVQWNNLQKFIYAKQLLKGAASIFVRSQSNINSWAKLKTALTTEFGSTLSSSEVHRILTNRKKRFKETYLEYLYVIMEIGKEISLDEKSIIDYFIEGLQDSRRNKQVLYEAQTIEQLKAKIQVYEHIREDPNGKNNNKMNFNGNTNERSRIRKCVQCPHLNNHTSEECKKLNNLCFKCGRKGHRAVDCPGNFSTEQSKNVEKSDRKFNSNNNQSQSNNRTNENNRQTYSSRPNEIMNEIYNHPSNAQRLQSKLCKTAVDLNIYIQINGHTIKALFDTGSHLSLLVESDYESLGDLPLIPFKTNIYGVGQGCLQTLGYFICKLTIDNQTLNWQFHVVRNSDLMSQSIIGSDILTQLNVFISENGANFRLKTEPEPLEDVLLAHMLGTEVNCEPDFEAGKIFKSICMDRSIDDTKGLNVDHLDKHNASKILNLVNNYKIQKIKSPNIKMKIVLTDDIPIWHRPRRLSIEDQNVVEKQIKEWLEQNIIKHSQSEYASPIVLANKKNNTKRLCCDYRKVNAKIIRDNFPMVLIEDALSKLVNAQIFTTLDLKNGFFHVPIEPESTKYTSFVTHRGQYEFLRAPFGMANSPAIFCRYITAIFNELIIEGTIIIYMDDIVIPAQSMEENLQKLTLVLKIASEHGLEINWEKCQFLQQKITFLGYEIENSSIKPSAEKMKAVKNFPQPKDIKSLQKFLGLTSYFRKFIQNYAVIARPLTDLLCKNTYFKFTDIQFIAFQQLKSALTESSVLRIYNPQALTEVHTDASIHGYGGVLMQKDMESSNWYPIEYMSRKTAPHEQKYHSYDLEVLAIIAALKKWRTYLLGIKFKIVTDCVAFTQTLKKTDVPARITRWVVYLQDFNYEIEHRSATKLRHADALSRVYCYMLGSSLKHRIMQAQDDDIWTKNLKEIVIKEKHPEFYVKNNILFKDYNKELLVIPRSLENEIIETAHREGHYSIQKTIDLIEKNFYIQNIKEKTTKIVRNCVPCLISEAKSGKKEGLLNPIDKTTQPLHTYHMDHVGPLEQTNKSYNHILAIIDGFTKFVWLYPTKSTGSNEVVQILQKQSIIFGNPKRIITDRGSAFTSQVFQDYCKEENIDHIVTTTGVPRGNGQVERVHRTVLTLLTKLCSDSPTKWYKHLGKIQQTLNNTQTRSTRETPFKILTGIPMRTHSINMISELLKEEELNEFNEARDNVRQKAKENIEKIQQENIRTFNKNRKQELEYSVGDVVAIKRTQFGSKLKIKPKFLGPYKVVKKKRMGRYEVERLEEVEGPKRTTTIAENMKPWH